jgi:hypothetical protein
VVGPKADIGAFEWSGEWSDAMFHNDFDRPIEHCDP